MLACLAGTSKPIADQHPPTDGTLNVVSLEVNDDGSWWSELEWDDGTGELVTGFGGGLDLSSLDDFLSGTGPGAPVECARQAKAACAIIPNSLGVCYFWVVFDSLGSWSCGMRCRYAGQSCPPNPNQMSELPDDALAWMN